MAEVTRVTTADSSVVPQGEFGYPVGHLGHLTATQETAFADYKNLCMQSGLYQPSIDGGKASHDDVTLL